MALDVIVNRIVNWPQLLENPAWLLRPVGLLRAAAVAGRNGVRDTAGADRTSRRRQL